MLVVNLVSLFTFIFFWGSFFFSLWLWFSATVYRHLEVLFTPHVFWLFQLVSSLLYLWRMAWRSFWLHGRRPIFIFFGFYQPGETFEWKQGIYEPGMWISHRLALYYDWWIRLQNPILVDSWLEEQNQTLFFRWGSFFRYLFLCGSLGVQWILGLGRRLLFRALGSELGHLLVLSFFLLFRGTLQFFSLFLWWFYQWWSRFFYAIGGEYYLLLFFRNFYLDSLVRYQWYQKDNVDSTDSPEEVHQKPLGLGLLRGLWYGFRRFTERRLFFWPASAGLLHLLGFFLLTLLLLPLFFFSTISFSFLWLFSYSHRWTYGFGQKFYGAFSLHKGALTFLWVCFSFFFFFASVLYRLPASVVYFWLAFWKSCCRWSFFLLAVLCLLFLSFGSWQELFRFGFGYIFWDFFFHLSSLVLPPTATLPFVPLDAYGLSAEVIQEMQEDWVDEIRSILGMSYYGGRLNGFPINPQPYRWVKWWSRPENYWWIHHPVSQYAHYSPQIAFLKSFQKILLSVYYSAKAKQVFYEKRATEWWILLEDWRNFTDVLWYVPFHGLYYAALVRYYTFLYKGFCPHPTYYWFSFARYHLPYAFTLISCAFGYVAVVWPFRALFLFLRSFCEHFWWLSSVASFFARSLGFLSQAFWGLLSFLLPLFFQGLSFGLSLGSRSLGSLCSLFLEGCRSLLAPSWVLLLDQRWDLSLVLWYGYGRWFYWLVSIVFWEFSQISLWKVLGLFFQEPRLVLAHLRQCLDSMISFLPLFFWEGQRNFSLWSLAISFYVTLQYFLDSLCVYLQFPRHLSDYSLFFKYRRVRRAALFAKEFSFISKGALFTGHHWALSPLILFRYALSEPYLARGRLYEGLELPGQLLPLSFVPLRWEKPQPSLSTFALDNLLALPFALVDAHRVLTLLGPFLYFLALGFFFASFSGASSFLLQRSSGGWPSSDTLYSRQWAWDQYRQQQRCGSLKDLEQLYWFPVSGLLVEAGARFEGPEHPAARALFRRGENFFLEQQKQLALPLASLKGRLQRQGSLGRGKSFLLEQLLSRQGVVLPFGQYLLSPRYEFLRSNFLHFGDRFLLFLAYYYSQEPWLRLCWDGYEDGDYSQWLPDLSLQLAEDLVAQGNSLRHLLQRTNARLFDNNLGEWLWSQDCGSFLVQQVSDRSLWGAFAYEVEDQDFDSYLPWATIYWWLIFPMFLFLNLYISLENPWVDDPVVAGTGSSELHRQTLCDYNIFGHFYFFYQQFEMRGWDIIPAEDRVDSPLANLAQIPVNGYKDSLTFNYPSAFYGVPIHWPYVSSRWTVFPGSWKPIGLLEEYYFFRLFSFFFLLLALGGALWRRPRASLPLGALPFLLRKDRWSTVRRYLRTAKTFYLWFWK